MQPTQKEAGLLKDLKDQEQLCVDKYRRHAASANDPQLKTCLNSWLRSSSSISTRSRR